MFPIRRNKRPGSPVVFQFFCLWRENGKELKRPLGRKKQSSPPGLNMNSLTEHTHFFPDIPSYTHTHIPPYTRDEHSGCHLQNRCITHNICKGVKMHALKRLSVQRKACPKYCSTITLHHSFPHEHTPM